MSRYILLFSLMFSLSASGQLYEGNWATTQGTVTSELVSSVVGQTTITENPQGGSYILYHFTDSTTVNLDTGAYTFYPVNPFLNNTGNLLCKVNENGVFTYAKFFPAGHQNNGMVAKNDGSLLLIGSSSGIRDLDPGPGDVSVNGTNVGSWIVELDPDGNYVSHIFTEGGADFEAVSIDSDEQGNIYFLGAYADGSGVVDVDPGTGSAFVSTSDDAMVIIKYDSDLNFIWNKVFTIGSPSYTSSAKYAHFKIIDDAILVYGKFFEQMNFNPAGGTYLAAVEGSDGFIIKLDTDGNYLWSNHYASYPGAINSTVDVEDVTMDDGGNVYVGGIYNDSIDLDSSPNTVNVNGCVGCYKAFVQKLDSNGDHVWAYNNDGYDGSLTNLSDVRIALNSAQDHLLLNLNFTGTVDMNPHNPPGFPLTAIGASRIISHLDSAGNFVWAQPFLGGQTGEEMIVNDQTVTLIGNYGADVNFLTASSAQSFQGHGSWDIFMSQFEFELYDYGGIVYTEPVSESGNCDAVGHATIVGGHPPFQYQWLGQIDYDSISSIDSACYGIHSLLVIDSVEDSLTIEYYITDEFGYYDWSQGTNSDTVLVSAPNCNIDYNLPIDSAFITNFAFAYPVISGPGDYYFLTVNYFQSGISHLYTDTVLVNLATNPLFVVNVYCPTRASRYISTMKLSIGPETNLEEASKPPSIPWIFPNPSTDIFYVIGLDFDELRIVNSIGQIVYKNIQKTEGYDISELADGVYVVSLMIDNKIIESKKIVVMD